MPSQKADYKSIEDIRTYVRDFFVSGYKGFEDYHRERGVSKSTVRDRANTIGTVFGDIYSKQRGANGYCRLVLDQSYPVRNPFHELYMQKSFTAKVIRRFFYAVSIVSTKRLSKNAFVKMMEGIDEQNNSDGASSAMYLLVDMLYDEGIFRRNARGIYSIADTSAIEALFAGKRFQAMLDFYSKTAPFGEIGSFICEKLKADGLSFRSEPPFMYRFRFPTQCLDSIVMYSILRAIQQKKTVRIESDDGKSFECSPQRFFISRQSGSHFLVFFHSFLLKYFISLKRRKYRGIPQKHRVCSTKTAQRSALPSDVLRESSPKGTARFYLLPIITGVFGAIPKHKNPLAEARGQRFFS